MKFISEEKLKEAFWSKYGYRKDIINYQFESTIRNGNTDLVTIEKYNYKNELIIQFNAFEFKLEDIKKAIAQAEENLPFVHKSFIVIPMEKQRLILDKYESYLIQKKHIGVIGVELNGTWKIIHQCIPKNHDTITLSNQILKLCCKEI